ncbi:MAG: hypothetical protein ACRCSL_16665 [Microbacterium sp.]
MTIATLRDLLGASDCSDEALVEAARRVVSAPRLRTCGPCRHLTTDPARAARLYCSEKKRALAGDSENRPVAPPDWCPLKEGAA